MRKALLAPLAALLALSATAARAGSVEYPVQETIFATGVDLNDIVTPDVTYPGPHAVVVKNYLPDPAFAALATSEDFMYPVSDPLPLKSTPARSTAPAVALHDCGCPCGLRDE